MIMISILNADVLYCNIICESQLVTCTDHMQDYSLKFNDLLCADQNVAAYVDCVVQNWQDKNIL